MSQLSIKFIPEVGKYYRALYLPAGEYLVLPNGKMLYGFSPDDLFSYASDIVDLHSFPLRETTKWLIKPVLKEHFHFERWSGYEDLQISVRNN